MRSAVVPAAVAFWLAIAVAALPANAQSPAGKARDFYKSGSSLFESGNKDQALIEFQLAQELDPQLDYIFAMAQCEYGLGKLESALVHYQQVLALEKTGTLADTARLRIEAIERRPSTLVINSAPADVQVQIIGGGRTLSGQAPNNFEVPSGRYKITVSKDRYVTRTQDVSIGIAQTKPLFFQLAPIPATLEIVTHPANATLYVRGNRAQSPYKQDVEAGTYEIYAEANDYGVRRETVVLNPGDKRTVDFALPYVQRSGRPELIGFWVGMGAVGTGGAVLARLQNPMTKASTPASLTLVGAAAAVGGIGGALVSRAFVPDYLRDNLALFRIGAMWIGATEGAAMGLALSHDLSWGWLGGAAGLGLGTVAGTVFDDRAPNYGRVAIIQSGAVMGALVGALAIPALKFDPENSTPRGVLVGLNIGLAAGLALAYLPDQRVYGPTWKRVILVDLAAAAGAFAGALTGTVDNCIGQAANEQCSFQSNSRTAKMALVGGAVGLVAGWLLTSGFDKNNTEPGEAPRHALLPTPSAIAVSKVDGSAEIIPGLAAQGRF